MPAAPGSRRLARRDVLRLAGVAATGAALAACTSSPAPGPTSASPGAPDDPDRSVRAEVAFDEAQLTALYADAAAALPAALAAAVTALGARHADYRAAVFGSATASATPTGSSSASPSAVPTASSPTTWLARLRAAERNAASSRADQAVRATDPELARTIVLAGTGAAGAAEVLRGLA